MNADFFDVIDRGIGGKGGRGAIEVLSRSKLDRVIRLKFAHRSGGKLALNARDAMSVHEPLDGGNADLELLGPFVDLDIESGLERRSENHDELIFDPPRSFIDRDEFFADDLFGPGGGGKTHDHKGAGHHDHCTMLHVSILFQRVGEKGKTSFVETGETVHNAISDTTSSTSILLSLFATRESECSDHKARAPRRSQTLPGLKGTQLFNCSLASDEAVGSRSGRLSVGWPSSVQLMREIWPRDRIVVKGICGVDSCRELRN
jgi:hypothetical protein